MGSRGRAAARVRRRSEQPIEWLICIETGAVAYLQVKRKLSFSLSLEDDLHNCLDQFVRQWISTKDIHCLAIITSSESSKRVTVTLPSTIDAIRSGSEADFRRDQNGSLVRDYDLIIDAIKAIYETHTLKQLEHDEALSLLQKLRVFSLDMQSGSAVEQAAYMILSARNCISPALFWGNLVADCASFATSRRSLEVAFIRERYARYFSDDSSREIDEKTSAARIFRSVIRGEISVGREIVIGTIDSTPQFPTEPGDVYVFEFYRFDEACRERITFHDGKCVLQNGLQINLLGRMATYVGLDRFLERKTEMLKSASRLLYCPANLEEDPDKSECANERRKLLAASIPQGDHPLECVHCGNPISSNDVDYIEYVPANGVPRLGLSHQNCTLPGDRVVGAIYSEFFKKYNFLRNFDAVTWFENISRGQGGYLAMSVLKGAAPLLTWSGRSARAGGTHIVEFELEGGTSEFSYHRGQLDRFPKAKAETYCIDFNKWVVEQREKTIRYACRKKPYSSALDRPFL